MRMPMRVFVIVCASAWAIGEGWNTGGEEVHAAELKTGVARVDLTPPLELNAPQVPSAFWSEYATPNCNP